MIILIVEDEGLSSIALEWALKLVGHQILGPADSVEQAIELMDGIRPDLSLLDLNLRHGGDGIMVARHLHQHHRTPALFLTGEVGRARSNRTLAWGLVHKPYDTGRMPRIVSFIDALVRRQPPPALPPHLEMFRWWAPGEHGCSGRGSGAVTMIQ